MKLHATTDLNNEAMLRGIRASDYEVFSKMYLHLFKGLALISVKYVQDVYIAEELVQDIFIKVWEQPHTVNGVIHLKSYLYKAVVNSSLNYLARQKNLKEHHERIARNMEDVDIQRAYEEQEMKVLIYQEIDRLPDQCKKVFKMSRFEGLKYREIAVLLNISERTVENHIANALKTLRIRFLANEEIAPSLAKFNKVALSLGLVGVLANCTSDFVG